MKETPQYATQDKSTAIDTLKKYNLVLNKMETITDPTLRQKMESLNYKSRFANYFSNYEDRSIPSDEFFTNLQNETVQENIENLLTRFYN